MLLLLLLFLPSLHAVAVIVAVVVVSVVVVLSARDDGVFCCFPSVGCVYCCHRYHAWSLMLFLLL